MSTAAPFAVLTLLELHKQLLRSAYLALLAVVLFDEDETVRRREAELVDARLAVLPKRVRRRAVDDDF